MVAIGIIVALIVLNALLAPNDIHRVYNEYCTMECIAERRHSNRIWYMKYR